MLKVSIIVPVFNVENYLGRCIESLLSQTFEDIEILLINDGSTDRSEEICCKFLKKAKNRGGLCQKLALLFLFLMLKII